MMVYIRSLQRWLMLSLLPLSVFSQDFDSERLKTLADAYTKSSFPDLVQLLSIPNDANFPEAIEQNVQWCEKAFGQRNFTTSRLQTKGAPLLLAERTHKNAQKTVLIYLQLDGQPVDTTQWSQENPYIPVLKQQNASGGWEAIGTYDFNQYNEDWRIFARSAADAKGPVAMFLAALDAIDRLQHQPNFHIKVIMDFEEELGSPNLPAAVTKHAERMASDMLVIFDGPLHRSGKPTLEFGARGIATMTLTTYGPIVPQHSGHFGNYAPNPALGLAQLLASMKDPQGRVTIPGYYEGVSIDEETRTILRAVPDDEAMIKEQLQLGSTDAVGSFYQEAIQYPSLNIRGMQSGWIDEKARTIIPGWARAEIDIRLVLESEPERLIRLVKEHIEKQGYYLTSGVPTKEERMGHAKVASLTHEISYQSFRTDFDTELGTWLRKALTKAYDDDIVMVRMGGGSVPISPFVNTLGIPAVIVPTVNIDNNQHSPNENLRIGNYRDGIRTMMAILTEDL